MFPRGIEFQIFGFRAPVLTRQACQLRQCCLDKTRNSPKSLQGNAMKCFEGLTMCSCSVTKIWESSEPVIVFRTSSTLLNSSLVFDFRGGVIKDSLPIQSLRDLIQEEEKKRNIPDQTPSPGMPIIPGKSGSTKKKLKYSTSLLKSLASLWSRVICNEQFTHLRNSSPISGPNCFPFPYFSWRRQPGFYTNGSEPNGEAPVDLASGRDSSVPLSPPKRWAQGCSIHSSWW